MNTCSSYSFAIFSRNSLQCGRSRVWSMGSPRPSWKWKIPWRRERTKTKRVNKGVSIKVLLQNYPPGCVRVKIITCTSVTARLHWQSAQQDKREIMQPLGVINPDASVALARKWEDYTAVSVNGHSKVEWNTHCSREHRALFLAKKVSGTDFWKWLNNICVLESADARFKPTSPDLISASLTSPKT